MRAFAALSFVLLATCASATTSSGVTVPLTKVRREGSPAKADRARAVSLKSRTANGSVTVPVTNWVVWYASRVSIGSPPAVYNLLVDTGSSNTWCGFGAPYNRTSTSIPTGESLNLVYGSGNVTGVQYLDQVALESNLVITNQSIGDALSFTFPDIPNFNGILGLGPVGLTSGTLSPDINATIPTVMNNLVSQGLIEKHVLGLYFAPSTNDSDTNGALTYGGIDPSLYVGEVTYVPLTATDPSAYYWGINITSSTYANYTIIPTSTAGIVDSGTTQVILADDFFDIYLGAIPGAKYNSTIGLIEIPHNSISSMHSLNFVIADRIFTLDVAAQLIPQTQNIAWGGEAGKQYLVVGPLGSISGQGFDFILGTTFMERYYAVFDTDASRVGFAQTKNTFTPCP